MEYSTEDIELYLEGKLDGQELAQFESRLRSDPTFAQEVQDFSTMIKELRSYKTRNVLKARMDNWHAEIQEAPKAKSVDLRRYFSAVSIAASIIVITGLAVFFVWQRAHTEQREKYIELRRDVENIKKSNKRLWKEVYGASNPTSSQNFIGTAFAISAEGYILTSYHVVKDADSVFLENEKYRRINAVTIYSNHKMDMAILKIKDSTFRSFGILPYSFKGDLKGLGNKVFTLGYPREDVVYGEGYISSKTGFNGDTLAYQVSIPLNPGNSGGPLLDDQGNIIGMVSGKHTEAEGAAFALKAYYLKRTLDKLKKEEKWKIKLPSYGASSYLKRPDQISKIQSFVFRVGTYD